MNAYQTVPAQHPVALPRTGEPITDLYGIAGRMQAASQTLLNVGNQKLLSSEEREAIKTVKELAPILQNITRSIEPLFPDSDSDDWIADLLEEDETEGGQ